MARFGVVLGQRPAGRDNNFMLDGVDNNETWLQTVVIFPSVDSLDEFKLQNIDLLRGVRPVARRRGQPADQVRDQRLPRQRLEFHRNDAFDANNFFNNKNNRPKPEFKQNQFGGTAGRSSRTRRFFGSYGHRNRGAGRSCRRFRPVAMRNGDFSSALRVIYGDRSAVLGQRHSRATARRGGSQHPDPALPRAEHRRLDRAAGGQASTTT